MLKSLKSGLFYKEYIIIWFKDREIQIRNNGQILLETLYDLDEDYPDKRVISNKERAVQRILDKITDKRFNQIEIWKVIQLKSWNNTDNTFKPICNRLRELRYKIVNNN